MAIIKLDIKRLSKLAKLPLKTADRVGKRIYWKAANASLNSNLQARIERIICKH